MRSASPTPKPNRTGVCANGWSGEPSADLMILKPRPSSPLCSTGRPRRGEPSFRRPVGVWPVRCSCPPDTLDPFRRPRSCTESAMQPASPIPHRWALARRSPRRVLAANTAARVSVVGERSCPPPLNLLCARFPGPREQFRNRNAERVGEFGDVPEGHVPEAALDSAHIGAV